MTELVRVVSGPKISVTVSSSIGADGSVFGTPGRTLFVAHSWPDGSDPAVCFTDPAAALAAASALTPAPDVNNPALIIFYPGLYTQAVTLVSNVHLCGHNARGCTISGAVTYAPGVGVNAAQTALFERVYITNMCFSGAFSIDTTGKASNQTTVDCRLVDLIGNVTHHGRAPSGGQDVFEMWDGVHGGTSWNFDGSIPLFRSGSEIGAATLTLSNCAFGAVFSASRVFSTLNLVNTPLAEGSGSKFVNVNVDGTSVFGPIPGGKTGVVTVASGGRADLRGAEYLALSNLAGAGAIDRSLWRTTFGPTTAGANTVSLAPAYIDANYSVQLTQTSGTASLVTVTGKQAGQFTLNDSVGGNTFDVAIAKE